MIHVLFDIDETILSIAKGLNNQASAKMFEKVFGVNTNEETVNNFSKTESWIIKEVLSKVNINIDKVPDKAYKVWAKETTKILKNNPPEVMPGIPELITALSKNKNIHLSLLTGNSPWRAAAKFHKTGLDTFFRSSSNRPLMGVFGNMSDERSELLIIYKKKINKGSDIVVIDDSLIGAMMAKKHKVPAILVATGRITKTQLQQYSQHVYDDFGNNRWKEIVSLITNIKDNKVIEVGKVQKV